MVNYFGNRLIYIVRQLVDSLSLWNIVIVQYGIHRVEKIVLDLIPLSPNFVFMSVWVDILPRWRGVDLENITGLFLDISSFCVQRWSNNKR